MIAETSEIEQGAAAWANRGWYLAVEYGVLARDRFLKRLEAIRGLGRFKELLEPGGAILYRNLFREDQVEQAWELLTLLRPWHEKLTCYVGGEEVPIKEVQDVLWCAAFLTKDCPCRAPEKKRARPAGCEGAQVLLGPGQWDLHEETRRHALTFSRVDGEGVLRFDRGSLATFAASSQRAQRCPRAPARDPAAFAAAFEEVPVRSLGWALIAEATPELRKTLGAKALEDEHPFVLEDEGTELDPHASFDLAWEKGEVTVRLAGARGPSLASEVKVPKAVQRVLEAGHLLRGVRMQEAYARRKGGHYVLEQRFVLSTRLHLLTSDRPARFEGYTLTTYPRATPEYSAWAERVAEALP